MRSTCLRFQVQELDAARIEDPDEDDVLDREESLLAGAAAHREAGERAVAELSDDGGTLDTLRSAIAALGGRGPYEAHGERLQALALELDDALAELRRVAESIDEDPERLAELRERRHLLKELRRKYGESLAEVMAFETETRERLTELESYESRAAALDADRGPRRGRHRASRRGRRRRPPRRRPGPRRGGVGPPGRARHDRRPDRHLGR